VSLAAVRESPGDAAPECTMPWLLSREGLSLRNQLDVCRLGLEKHGSCGQACSFSEY